jgi:hypothetical protein
LALGAGLLFYCMDFDGIFIGGVELVELIIGEN